MAVTVCCEENFDLVEEDLTKANLAAVKTPKTAMFT